MTSAIAPVAALLLSVALLLTGNGLQGTLLPIRAQIEGFSTLSVGLVGSFYFIGFAVGCVHGPVLIRRAGHIRTFTAMAAMASAVPLLHALAPVPAPWWVMRLLTGYAFAVLYIVIESWLNERATNETRGTVLSVYQVINLTVLTLGQMMITLADPRGFALFAVSSVLVSVAAIPVALTAAMAPGPVKSVRVHVLHIWRISPVGFAGCLAVGLANGAWWSLAPVFASGAGLDVAGIAVFMSITVLTGAAGQWPVGHLSDRMDRRKVLAGACVVSAIAAAVTVSLAQRGGLLIYGLGALWGAASFCIYAISVAHTNDYAESDRFVQISSGLLLAYAGGAVLGPMAAAGAMAWIGGAGLFAFTGCVHVGLALFALWRMTRRAPAPLEAHVAFHDALAAATTVSAVFDAEIQAAHGDGSAAVPATPPPARE